MMAKHFARVYRDNSILTAGPGQLVLMMFDGALNAIAAARAACDRPATDFRRIETIHKQIVKAQRIIAQLNGTLNFDVGGDFAPLMRRLYLYYHRRLHEANLRKDPAPLIEVEQLLRTIRDAWAEMLSQQGRSPEPAAPEADAVGAGSAVPAYS